jgi:isopenicillin N synthase-like dioxygenase
MIVYTPARPADHIPLIDLAGSFDDEDARRRVAWDMHRACRETGFFYVAGHGVPQALMDAQLDAAHRLFDLPEPDKQALHVRHSPCRRGYEGPGAQMLDE